MKIILTKPIQINNIQIFVLICAFHNVLFFLTIKSETMWKIWYSTCSLLLEINWKLDFCKEGKKRKCDISEILHILHFSRSLTKF